MQPQTRNLPNNTRRLLIISPHFPPINSPDSQRVRMSLPYYHEMGWEPIVVCVAPDHIEGYRDTILEETLPTGLEVHRVEAWPLALTQKIGIGSLSIRSFFFFLKKVNQLLRERKFDLIFFSTTAFHVCALGPYWKKKFKIPFVMDLQDPWRNDFYLDKPRSQRPPKFWLAYNLDKLLEAYTMPFADAIMAVSEGYISMMRERYPKLKNRPAQVIPFGASIRDFELVQQKSIKPFPLKEHTINVVYVGAVTPFFLPLIRAFLLVFSKSIANPEAYHFYFIGTNYSKGANHHSVKDLAEELGIGDWVSEYPDRIPYFSALATLARADILFVPGSMDVDYNASKIYNNILSGKPIFSIFHEQSLVKKIIEDCAVGVVVGVQGSETAGELEALIQTKIDSFRQLHLQERWSTLPVAIQPFLAAQKTQEQVELFNQVGYDSLL